jgi:hypothetical protein
MTTLPPLATVDDLTARLGRPLNPAESSRVGALITDASGLIRRYCRKDFEYHADDTKTLRADGGVVKLPYRPVDSVTSVTAKSGISYIPDIPITWYVFDGIDEITILDAAMSGIMNLPEVWYQSGTFAGTFIVKYSHGYHPVRPYPDDVIGVCANSVISVLQAPNQASGVIGETIGPYSYRVVRSGGGVKVALDESDLAILDDFREKFSTIHVGGY